MKPFILIPAFVGLVIVAAMSTDAHDGPHGGPDEATFKVGKNGDIKIGEDMKVGPVLVKRGKYQFEHRVAGDRHTVVLTRLEAKAAEALAYELPMTLIPSQDVAKRTAMFAKELADHSLAMTAVEVTGEKVEHVPDIQALATK